MKTPRHYRYDIDHPGEIGAGIHGFTDRITITVDSGDPGGDETGDDSFQEFMLNSLREWYDGAGVRSHD